MAIYSKTLSDEKILAFISEKSKTILIVACGGCVNESLAYDNDVPIIICDDQGDEIPYASHIETLRITEMPKSRGYNASIKLVNGALPVLCIFSLDGTNILESKNAPDVILTLSCVSGAIGLRTLIKTPIYTITRQEGYLAYTYTTDADGNRVMIKEQSQIAMFQG
jgi:hypothetical protein